MDRATVYAGQLPLETDILRAQQFAMIGLGKLAEGVLGTGTYVDGFTISPTNPASMSVVIGPGTIYTLENIEGAQWSALPVDSRSIVKQGLLLDAISETITAPGTPGTSQAFLIQAGYSDIDDGQVVRPYFDAENPDVPFEGPGNDSEADTTQRRGAVAITIKAGLAVSNGAPVAPPPDPGYVPLFVVTCAAGQTTIAAGNLAISPNAPFITPKLPAIPSAIQTNKYVYARDVGTAGHMVANVSPPPAGLQEGMSVRIRTATDCPGATDFNLNGFGALPVVLSNGAACSNLTFINGAMLDLTLDAAGRWQISGMSIAPTPMPSIPSYGSGEGVLIDGNRNANLNFPALTGNGAVNPADLMAIYAAEAEGGLPAGHHYAVSIASLWGFFSTLLPALPSVPNARIFLGNSTYVPSAGVRAIAYAVTGGGAGGNGAADDAASAGGAAGATALGIMSMAGVGNLPVVVGGGGAAGAGASTVACLGGAGGTSSLGGYAVAGGGNAGVTGGGTWYRGAAGADGGTATAGLILIKGGSGLTGVQAVSGAQYIVGTAGAPSFWGGGGAGSFYTPYGNANPGQAGVAYGSGGGGGSANSGYSAAGGPGAQGIIIIIELF